MDFKTKSCFSAVLGVVLAFVASATLANTLPLDNRITPIINDDPSKISFTDVFIDYKPGAQKKKGPTGDGGFTVSNTSISTFTLNMPGYDGISFDGNINVSAKISPFGVLSGMGSLEIMGSSADDIFGFGTSEVCRKKKCTTVNNSGLILGADLTDFGWSGTEGIVEFVEENLTGWAAELGSLNGAPERLIFFTDPFELGNSESSFQATADGIAVVPVPAAVWLFGSGLLGLVGVARRKKSV